MVYIVILLISLIFLFGILMYTGLRLDPETEAVIEELIEKGPEDLHTGETGFAMNGDIQLFYERFGNPEHETVLLVHGHSAPSVFWPLFFVEELVDAGYQVIRFDNRGLGKSDWIKDWNPSDPYTLEDMATDALAILDHLKIEKVHLVGCSMGGMISQRITISHPERVHTLCSLMSSGYYYDPKMTQITPWVALSFARSFVRWASIKDERKFLKFSLGIRATLHGDPKDFNGEDIKVGAEESLFVLRRRGGVNLKTRSQHTAAIKASGSRLEELTQVKVPTMVIHGTKDPLILPKHAEKYGPIIPGAEVVMIEGLGHMISKKYNDQLVEAMVRNFKRHA